MAVGRVVSDGAAWAPADSTDGSAGEIPELTPVYLRGTIGIELVPDPMITY
ncbi:hypothetical protein Elgi_13730 [Paenibacillus elgii]|nr:hypothetical protein Elgi_13730 [Paenibacillus elgii]